MQKKLLLEQLAALKQKRDAELNRLTLMSTGAEAVTQEMVAALAAMDDEVKAAEAKLAALESLEQMAARKAAETVQDRARVESVRDLGEDRPFENLGEFLQDVAMSPERPNDGNMAQVAPRLRKFAPTGSNITTPSDGGYMIGKTFGDLIIRRIYETGQIIGQAPPPIPVDATGKLEFPIVAESSRVNGSRWGGVQVYRNTEAETVTATRPKLEGFTLTTHKLNGIWYASEELLRNAPAMTQLAETAFSAEMQFKIESEMWSGNGVGQCLGIFPTGGTARIVVAKETSQTAATINVANISKMWSRMPAALRNNAVWFISQEAEPQLDVLAIANQPVYMPPGGLSGRPLGLLKGRPVIVIEHAEALGTENDITLVNLRDTYLLGQQGGVSSASSIHVRFLHGETTFKWTWYVGGKPTFTVPITPLKGSTTLSPYVTLATRA